LLIVSNNENYTLVGVPYSGPNFDRCAECWVVSCGVMYILKNVYDLDMNAYEEQVYRTRIAKIRRIFAIIRVTILHTILINYR